MSWLVKESPLLVLMLVYQNLFKIDGFHVGQLGYTYVDTQATPRRVSSLKAKIVVTAANKHTAVVSDSGEVFTWGCNKEGQLGYGTSSLSSNYTPKLIEYFWREEVTSGGLECGC